MRKRVGVVIIVCLLVALSLPVAAGISEYTDQGYNFAKVRTVLITEPSFVYSGVMGRDEFEKYPDSARVITAILNNKLKKTANLRYVTWDYVVDRVKANPDLECDPASPEFAALVKREMPQYVDLVLNTTIVNFGWLRQFREAYDAYETVTDRVHYKRKLPDGREESGWMDVERTVFVHHPAHYEVIDSAEAQLYLFDPRTGKNAWTYGEKRTRSSPGGSGGYDRTGPESVMNRIFIEAMDHIPLYPKEKSSANIYN